MTQSHVLPLVDISMLASGHLEDRLSVVRKLDRACAEICRSAASVMAQHSEFANRLCIVCAEICQACALECGKHKDMPHCQECAQICNACSKKCLEMAEHK